MKEVCRDNITKVLGLRGGDNYSQELIWSCFTEESEGFDSIVNRN